MQFTPISFLKFITTNFNKNLLFINFNVYIVG